MNYAFYNGEYAPRDELKIPLFDRSIFFGDGVYDCMIGGKRGVYQLDKHLARLQKNAKLLYLDFGYSYNQLNDVINTLIRLSRLERYIVYIQVSRYAKERRHYCIDFTRCNLLITITEAQLDYDERPISLLSLEDIRYKMCNIKTLNLLPSVLASRHAESAGYDEAVLIRDGIVTECAHSNISIIKNGSLYTHPLTRDILPGITRENLLGECRKMNIPVYERCFGYEELICADEIIVTSTTHFARRVEKIDKNSINFCKNSPFYELSRHMYSEFIECCC